MSDALSGLSQLQQFVDAESSGTAVAPPGSNQTISLQEFDFLEQLLLTSGLYLQAKQSALSVSHKSHDFAQGSTATGPESTILAATNFCRNSARSSQIFNSLEENLLHKAFVSGSQGAPASFLLDLAGAIVFANLSQFSALSDTACQVFPIDLTTVTFTGATLSSTIPPSLHFQSTTIGQQTIQLQGSFSACVNVATVLGEITNITIQILTDGLSNFVPDKTLILKVAKSVAEEIAGVLITFVEDRVGPLLDQYINIDVSAPNLISATLDAPTVNLFPDNFGVAVAIQNPSYSVQPIGPGLTEVRANLSSFDLALLSGTACVPIADSFLIPGNDVQVSVVGPAIVIPTNSGASTGIIPGTLNGNPIDKAYIALPGSFSVRHQC